MRKLILILLLIVPFQLFAPNQEMIYLIDCPGVNIYEPLIKAIVKVESNNGKYMYNESEGAVGHFQIREVRLSHYNRLTGLNHTLNECYDYEISRKVFLYFAVKYDSYEKIAKSWNGSGPMTVEYWKRVSKHLNN